MSSMASVISPSRVGPRTRRSTSRVRRGIRGLITKTRLKIKYIRKVAAPPRRHSRKSRESLATPHRLDQGTGNREQGNKEQGLRQAPLTRRSEEHTSDLQSLMRISYAVFCLKKNTHDIPTASHIHSAQRNRDP